MSMPTIPDSFADITQEQTCNMMMAAIAMVELALSHIINAEAEKLQYVLGTLPDKPCQCTTTEDVLQVNRSISEVLEKVMNNMLLVKGTLALALENKNCSCQEPKPPRPCSCDGTNLYHADRSSCNASCLQWCCDICPCKLIFQQEKYPEQIYLAANHTYLISYSFYLCTPRTGSISVTLSTIKNCNCYDIYSSGGYSCGRNLAVYVSGSTAFTVESREPAPIFFTFKGPYATVIDQAKLSITVLH